MSRAPFNWGSGTVHFSPVSGRRRFPTAPPVRRSCSRRRTGCAGVTTGQASPSAACMSGRVICPFRIPSSCPCCRSRWQGKSGTGWRRRWTVSAAGTAILPCSARLCWRTRSWQNWTRVKTMRRTRNRSENSKRPEGVTPSDLWFTPLFLSAA